MKIKIVVAFSLVLFLWLATISQNMLGFVAPVNAEAVGFDLWTAIVWAAFLFMVWKMWCEYVKYRLAKARKKLDAVLDDITAKGGTINREAALSRVSDTPETLAFKEAIRLYYPEEIPVRDAHELLEWLESPANTETLCALAEKFLQRDKAGAWKQNEVR